MASNLPLEYIILTNGNVYHIESTFPRSINQLSFLSKTNGRQVQTAIQNALSTCTEPKLVLCLLDFCLPEKPTATPLLPSHCVPVPAQELQDLFDLLIIVY